MLHLNDSLVESELSASSVMVILCNLQIGEREGLGILFLPSIYCLGTRYPFKIYMLAYQRLISTKNNQTIRARKLNKICSLEVKISICCNLSVISRDI